VLVDLKKHSFDEGHCILVDLKKNSFYEGQSIVVYPACNMKTQKKNSENNNLLDQGHSILGDPLAE